MVNSSAMVEPTVVVSSGDDGPELSFSEILESSPPPSSSETHFVDEGDTRPSQQAGVRRQSSRLGLFGRLTNSKIRNSVLRRDGAEERGRPGRTLSMQEQSQRQSSMPAMRVAKRPAGTQRNPSWGGDDEEPMRRASAIAHTKERIPRMTFDPPPLGSAYSQATKHGAVMAPLGSVETILRAHKTGNNGKKPTLEPPTFDKRSSTPEGNDCYAAKLYILTSTGYLLQYAREGNYDRMPEKIMQLTSNSAAIACDAISGKHWVLHVSATFGDEPAPHHRSRFGLSKLGLGGSTKSGTRNFLLVMDSADELDAWLVALRREIHSLGGADYKPDVTEEKSLEEQVEDSIADTKTVIQKPASLRVERPAFNRATSAPERVAAHRITNSMAKHGLLLRMDESESEEETEVTIGAPNSQAQQHGHSDATSPHSVVSITDKSSHRSRPSTDTVASRTALTGRRRSESQSQSQQLGQAPFSSNDLDSVIESIIPRDPRQFNVGSHGRKKTGLRKKVSIATAESTSPLTVTALSETRNSSRSSLQPLTSGFKRLSPLADIGPIVLTPPESPELSLRPRSLSMLENETTAVISPGSISLQSPISDPGMLSPHVIPREASAESPKSSMSLPRKASASVGATNDQDYKASTGAAPTGWIPPRQSSLLYSQGFIPSSGTSSGRSTPSSGRKGSITPARTEKLKSRLAALDVINIPAPNAHLLTPSPHPPPTGALPELPKNQSPAQSRVESRQDQSRQSSVVSLALEHESAKTSNLKRIDSERMPSAASSRRTSDAEQTFAATTSTRMPHDFERAPSATSIRKLSKASRSGSTASTDTPLDAVRATTPEPAVSLAIKNSSSPIEQITPRKTRVDKIILPPMSQVPAMRPSLPMHPTVGPPPNLTVAERRRRRSPSPINSRARSGSNTEKVLSAISEMTEASDAATIRERRIGMDEMITIGLEVPVEEPEFQEQVSAPAPAPTKSSKNLLPNGMPNPLAGNPIGTPDMRMIPHQPTREAPAPPTLDDLQPPVPPKGQQQTILVGLEVETTQEKQKPAPAPQPLGRKLSMRERAAAAIAAAKATAGPKREAQDILGKQPKESRSTYGQERQSDAENSEGTASTHKRIGSGEKNDTRPVFHARSSSLEHRLTHNKAKSQTESLTDTTPINTAKPSERTASASASAESEAKTQAIIKPQRPTSAMEKEVLISGPHPTSHKPAKHIAELLFIPELPAEPTTPPPPEMKASITAFGQDEFDMWAYPIGTPKSAASEFAPLQLDLGSERGNERPKTSGGRDHENREKPRWSLFNAIEGIQ